MTAYADFCAYVAEINDLLCILNTLTWDARTQMPPGGAVTRGHQMATISRLAQERFTAPQMGDLLAAAEAELQQANPDGYPARAVRSAREAYTIARRIPPALVGEMAVRKATAQEAWIEAKATNNFPAFAPELEIMVRLNRQLAQAIGYGTEPGAHPYDALLFQFEPGMTAARLQVLFAELRGGILPLLRRIVAGGRQPDAGFLTRSYDADKQRAFALGVAQEFGYDLRRGRLDASPHPFEISFTRDDVRMTTRYQENFLPGALFGVLHETGHALYEQGVDPALTRSAHATDFLGLYAVGGASYGAHESQSRLWENQIGRSRAFWARHFGALADLFPAELAGVDVEQFYRAVNRVQPSLIRVEADEVTYNLHIMVRVEIEMALLEGSLPVADLPGAWNAKMEEYLGLTPPSDSLGVLQDIHWSTGLMGNFPTYTVGNVMSAQFMAAAQRQVPGLDASLAAGDYRPLLAWLTANIYRHGRAFTPSELLLHATGEDLQTGPYLAYLENKFGELYPA
jgi:carboxypeptidase Taq